MTTRELLLNELEETPEPLLGETAQVSEPVLGRDWLRLEEDEAWQDL